MKRLCVALQIVRNALALVLGNDQYGWNCILPSQGSFFLFSQSKIWILEGIASVQAVSRYVGAGSLTIPIPSSFMCYLFSSILAIV